MSMNAENSSGTRIPPVGVPPSAPPITPATEGSYEAAISMPQPPQYSQSQPYSTPPPSYSSSQLPPYTVNANQSAFQPAPEPQVIYVVQPIPKSSGCSMVGRLCMYRLIGTFIGLIVVGIIISIVTSKGSSHYNEWSDEHHGMVD